jgi:hypothetical protein
MAAITPKGITATLISSVITNVPKMAGKIPPSVLASRGSSLRKAPDVTEEQPEAGHETELVGKVEMEQLTDGNGLFLAGHEPVGQGILLERWRRDSRACSASCS